MRRWQKINRIPMGPLAGLVFLGCLALALALWLRPPGLDVRDGRNDRGKNGIVLGSGWIVGDAGKPAVAVGDLARSIREHHITEVYLQIPPPNGDGVLAALDAARTEALLYECYDARGWAQINGASFLLDDVRWRRFFIVELRRLLDRHPRLRGVQLDLTAVADGNAALLTFLDELRPAPAPDTRPISIAAGAWSEVYFREVARRADQLIIPLEVSASVLSRFSTARNLGRIGHALAWSESKPVLFRIPADKRLRRAMGTIHLGLSRQPLPDQYQGIILDAGDAPTSDTWTDLRMRFLRP